MSRSKILAPVFSSGPNVIVPRMTLGLPVPAMRGILWRIEVVKCLVKSLVFVSGSRCEISLDMYVSTEGEVAWS